MLVTITHELIEKLDEHVHYGAFKSGTYAELFPAQITLSVRTTKTNADLVSVGGQRYIVFEEGKQAFYRWYLSSDTGYDEEFTRPYEHPGYDEWYGR